VILDDVQRRPEIFPLLRSLVDDRIRAGERTGHFLVLGSASRDLLQQSSESLAGRIAYLELTPLTLLELAGAADASTMDTAWVRGGFPGSYLAPSEDASWEWRGQFIATYLERDLPQLGPRLPAEQVRRLWTMLAHGQGDVLNAAKLAAGLGVSGNTVRKYLDVLTDLYMVRQLAAWAGNSRKRLVRSPKVYVRDTWPRAPPGQRPRPRDAPRPSPLRAFVGGLRDRTGARPRARHVAGDVLPHLRASRDRLGARGRAGASWRSK